MTIQQTQDIVKSSTSTPICSKTTTYTPGQPARPIKSMIHHNALTFHRRVIYKGNCVDVRRYGVSREKRVLTPGLLFKQWQQVRRFLQDTLRLSTAEREVVFRLLRFWSYYSNVYPRESFVTQNPGCSKATFWRTIRKLQAGGLISVVNRFLVREKAQISNQYLLHKLILMIARYLAERGVKLKARWLQPYLCAAGSDFWGMVTFWEGAAAPGT